MLLQERNRQFTVTLPRKVLEGLGWAKGDKLAVQITGKNRLELVKEQ